MMQNLKWFRLEGYNSGGYKSEREVYFNGNLEYIHYYDDDNKVIKYIKVTHADGSVTQEDNDFLQKLLDEQSYKEGFLVTGIEEIHEGLEERVKEYRHEKIHDLLYRLLAIYYKSRYLLLLPLFYYFGQWLEGLAERVVFVSGGFVVLTIFLLSYVVLYFYYHFPYEYPKLAIFYHVVLLLVYVFLLFNYQNKVDGSYEIVRGVFIGFWGIHLAYYVSSLFSRRVL